MRNILIKKIKKMNKAILLLLVISATFVSSCSEDMLDQTPLYAISEDDVFNDAVFLDGYLSNVYNGIKRHHVPEAGGYIGLTDLALLQVQTNRIGSVGEEYLTGAMTAENVNTLTQDLWAHQYGFISKANIFFEQIESSEIAPEDLTPLTGQMRFLRAYMYFELIRHFGGVPLITTSFGLDAETFEVARNTYDECTTFILSELELAITELKSSSEVRSGRSSKEAAMALKAKMLLYMASPLNNPGNDVSKWQAAAIATKAVIDAGYTLHAEFKDVFHDPVKEEEIILARSYTAINRVSSGGGWGHNYDFWPSGFDANQRVTPTQTFVNSFQMSNGEYPYLADGITVNPVSGYDPQNPNVDRDPRYYTSVLYSGGIVTIFDGAKSAERAYEYWEDKNPEVEQENPDWDGNKTFDFGKDSKTYWVAGKTPFHWNIQTGYTFKKLTDFTGPRASWDHDYDQVTSYFRLPEIYLNYAEIQLALDNEDLARQYINMVRQRASVNMPDVISTGADLVRDYKNERIVELHLEDTRFYDLMRWKEAGGTVDLNPTRGITSLTKDWSNNGLLEYEYGVITDNRSTWPGDFYYLFPIPRDEINKSNNALIQNPGYD
jgi:hypothetical protein